MSTRRATISDVARAAGVSPSTASVVFSGKVSVSDATRARVLQAAQSLGYSGPDPRAASLRTGRAGIVAVLFRERLGAAFRDPVTVAMMDGLSDAIGPIGAGVLLLHDEGPDEASPTLTSAPLDAAILLGCNDILQASVDVVTRRGIPVVVIEGDAGPEVPRILLDNVDAQRTAAEHLRSLGHRDVAIVTLTKDASRPRGFIDDPAQITVEVTRDRLRGARDVFPEAPAYAVGASSIDEGLAAGRVLLDERTITRRRREHDDPTEDLTPSEVRVVDLIGEGLSNREIAERLSIAEKTVKNHITSLLAKMGLQRRTQVAAWVAARKHHAWAQDSQR